MIFLIDSTFVQQTGTYDLARLVKGIMAHHHFISCEGEGNSMQAIVDKVKVMDSSPVNTVVYLKSSDKTLLNSIKTRKNLRNDPTLKMFALDADMMDAYDRGDAEAFAQKRGEMINKIERNFLDSCGLCLE